MFAESFPSKTVVKTNSNLLKRTHVKIWRVQLTESERLMRTKSLTETLTQPFVTLSMIGQLKAVLSKIAQLARALTIDLIAQLRKMLGILN